MVYFAAVGVDIEVHLQTLSPREHCESQSFAIRVANSPRDHDPNRLLPSNLCPVNKYDAPRERSANCPCLDVP